MKKPKKVQYKQVKNYTAHLAKLGEEGWRLVAVDGDEGIFTQEPSPVYEYTTVLVDVHPRRPGESLRATLDAMTAEGWRLVSTLQGPRSADVTMLFEREVGG